MRRGRRCCGAQEEWLHGRGSAAELSRDLGRLRAGERCSAASISPSGAAPPHHTTRSAPLSPPPPLMFYVSKPSNAASCARSSSVSRHDKL
ncbi:hypothetical protein SETIT_8G123200v2 [Setaria italica]|uniref:Uncharacterized protein n=1 Tax=Setaria italica TaxID=4555 RepID=A0A368S8L2_SETIT|nr:hypothetical protein SETIT_8G123200v2 [Setaria italica]